LFDFLGKIPNNILLACSGNKNSMAVVEFLSRTDRRIKLLHIDFKDVDSKDRVQFIKNAAKIYKMDVEILKPSAPKKDNEYPDHYKNREIYNTFTALNPNYVVMSTNLDDVVLNYVLNAVKCQPKLIQYRSKNIIRPYINTPQDEFDHWIKSKRVGYFEPTVKPYQSQVEFVRKYMLDNCIKLNPNLVDDVLNGVNEDFNKFMELRRSNNG